MIANCGEKAVEIVASNLGIDLVLMDIDLGKGMDGTQAAEKILSGNDLPIVFLSSHTESEIVAKTEKITSYGYVVKNSSITVLDASIKMAFKLFYANRQTVESEKRFHLLFNSIQAVNTLYEVVRDGCGTPVDYRYLEVNPAFEKLVGMPARELIGKTLLEVFPQTERYWLDAFKEIVEKNTPGRFEQYSRELNSHTELYVYLPQENQLAMSSRDISDRKQAEASLRKKNEEYEALNEKLKRNEERYHSFFKLSNEAMLLTAPEGDILAANSAACEMFGASEGEIMKNGRKGIMDVTDPRLAVALEQRKKTGFFSGELTCIRKNGDKFACELSSSVFSDVDGLQKTGIVIRDISARKQAEERMAVFLAEKELLLKEVHHRIKNNMSAINGLLVLQAGTLKDPAAVNALEDAGKRIKSMQLLYDKLYRSSDFNQLPLCDYLDPLVDEVISNFPNRTSVRVEKDISAIVLKIAKLQPLGIIVNELLSNTMKYAFIGRTAGLVAVTATVADKLVTLTIADNGNGMPESVDFEHSTGFGLVLVNGLTQQLDGTIRMEHGEGTKVVLEFGE